MVVEGGGESLQYSQVLGEICGNYTAGFTTVTSHSWAHTNWVSDTLLYHYVTVSLCRDMEQSPMPL